jgi:hypothetical protein
MNNPGYRETGWPGVCNVVSSTGGNGTLAFAAAGKRVVLVGAHIKGDTGQVSQEDEVTLKVDDSSGTVLVHLNENTGLFPGRIRLPAGTAVYLDGNVSCTLWYYIETP